MYERITGENPYTVPMRIYPAVHYTMGGLWVDYNLMSTIKGLFVAGEANFSDHGANRLGASALMQGLADGYFIVPVTVADYLAQAGRNQISDEHAEVKRVLSDVEGRTARLLGINGKRSPDSFHRELGQLMWDNCGMARSSDGLRKALQKIPELRDEFYSNLRVVGDSDSLNQQLEKAGRVADFMELTELICADALHREESCGGHFRAEHQTEEVRPSGTTTASSTLPLGSLPETFPIRRCTRNRWTSNTCTRRRGATSNVHNESGAARVAAVGARQKR